MDTLDYDFFFKQLKAGNYIDETCFYFIDDEKQSEHYLGFLPKFDLPYWIGYCDVPDGKEYKTAEELVNDKVFDGKSLIERWNELRINSIEGISLDDWLQYCKHVE